jgi:hypothetical protein
MAGNAGPGRFSRRKRAAFAAVLLLVAGAMALAAGELVLRLFSIPGIKYHSFQYDSVTGGHSYPHSTLMYRGDDGVLVTHRANARGFPDVEHEKMAPPGTLRIGFFGDSYTEALQVPLEQSFFRLIEGDLDTRTTALAGMRDRDGTPVRDVETFGFGMSGRSALQSWLESRKWMEPLDLDLVVYVFVENDPADQVRALKGSDIVPYPVLAADSFVIDDSFNRTYGYKASWWHRVMQGLKSRSLVVSTLEGRLKLLKQYGIKRRVTEADREGAAGGGGSPMAPSAWPPDLVEPGWELQERVMDRWRRDVEAQGRRFVILRVPRGESVVAEPLETQDTWAARLHAYCARRGVALVDPTPFFLARQNAGEKMYHDHFTPAGHRAFADAFVHFLVEVDGSSSAPAP